MTTSFTLKANGPKSILAERLVEDLAVPGTHIKRVLEGETIYPGKEFTFSVWGDDEWRISEIE